MSKQMPFLINPPKAAKKTHRRKRRVVKRATHRRTKTASRGAVTMAKKKRRRHNVARRRNPVHAQRAHRRVHHRRRRNPSGFSTGGLVGQVTNGLMDGLVGVGGKTGARWVGMQFGFVPGSITSALVEMAVGVIGGMGLKRVLPAHARAFVQGAFMAPIETFAVVNKVPVLSQFLGDYGTMNLPYSSYNAVGVAPAYQVGAGRPGMAGYPVAQPGMGGYPPQQLSGYADNDFMGEFDSHAGRYGR